MIACLWGWWLLDNGRNPKNEHNCSFLGLLVARWQREVETPKMSNYAHFRGWCWTQKGRNPKNERSCSFSGLVMARDRLQPQRQAVMLVSGLVVARERCRNPENEQSCSFWGWWWPERGYKP
jgi:hypothetical protein